MRQPLVNNMDTVQKLTQLSKLNAQLDRFLKSLGSQIDTNQARAQAQKTIQVAHQYVAGVDAELSEQPDTTRTNKLRKTLNQQRALLQRYETDFSARSRLITVHSDTRGGAYSDPGEPDAEQQLAQQMKFKVSEFDVKEYEAREEGIYEINKQLNEINEAFVDLNEAVVGQQEDFDALESHVESARDNVQLGTTEVVKADILMRKKRKRMCTILCCLVVLGGVIAIICVTSK